MVRSSLLIVTEQLKNAMEKLNRQQNKVDNMVKAEKSYIIEDLNKMGLNSSDYKFEQEVDSFLKNYIDNDKVYKKEYITLLAYKKDYKKIEKSYQKITNQTVEQYNER